jgi:hypothetical protein
MMIDGFENERRHRTTTVSYSLVVVAGLMICNVGATLIEHSHLLEKGLTKWKHTLCFQQKSQNSRIEKVQNKLVLGLPPLQFYPLWPAFSSQFLSDPPLVPAWPSSQLLSS